MLSRDVSQYTFRVSLTKRNSVTCGDVGKESHAGQGKNGPLHQETSSRPDQFVDICGACSSAPAVEACGCDADPPAGSSCFPAINNQAAKALSTANAAPSNETRRKALTNDSSIARLSAVCDSPLTLVGMVMPASLVRCASIRWDTPGDRCRVARWLSRLFVKTANEAEPSGDYSSNLVPSGVSACRVIQAKPLTGSETNAIP